MIKARKICDPAADAPSATYTGHDAERSYLLTVWPDGTREIAVRPYGSGEAWSPPVRLEAAQ